MHSMGIAAWVCIQRSSHDPDNASNESKSNAQLKYQIKKDKCIQIHEKKSMIGHTVRLVVIKPIRQQDRGKQAPRIE